MGVPRESSVQVQPKVANLLGSGNGDVVQEDGWTRLTTECGGEVGTLSAIHLVSPSPAPFLDQGGSGGFGRWF